MGHVLCLYKAELYAESRAFYNNSFKKKWILIIIKCKCVLKNLPHSTLHERRFFKEIFFAYLKCNSLHVCKEQSQRSLGFIRFVRP